MQGTWGHRNLCTVLARKLRERYIGPFKILRRVARYAYELDVKDAQICVTTGTPSISCGVVMEIYTTSEEDVATGGDAGIEDAV